MKVLFRADASVEIGTGHVVRCATLAQSLRNDGAEVLFACRTLPGHLNDWLRAQQFTVLDLPPLASEADSVSFQDALSQPKQLSDAPLADWLVVDHYGLDANWESQMRSSVRHILAIDDLANRLHDCDVLLDQNFFGTAEKQANRYAGLVSPSARLLLGPTYALLRPEFAIVRERIVKADKRNSAEVNRILVFFGGSDPTGETDRALDALNLLAAQSDPSQAIQADVIVGASNPKKEAIQGRCDALPWAGFHCQVSDMHRLMGNADMAIGAGGTTAWERCALGLPTLVVAVADNQEQISQELAHAGAQHYLGRSGDVNAVNMASAVQDLLKDASRRHHMSESGMALVDGNGVSRIAEAIQTLR